METSTTDTEDVTLRGPPRLPRPSPWRGGDDPAGDLTVSIACACSLIVSVIGESMRLQGPGTTLRAVRSEIDRDFNRVIVAERRNLDVVVLVESISVCLPEEEYRVNIASTERVFYE